MPFSTNHPSPLEIAAMFRAEAEKYLKAAEDIEKTFNEGQKSPINSSGFAPFSTTMGATPQSFSGTAKAVREYIEQNGPRRPVELALRLGLDENEVRSLPDDLSSGIIRNNRGWLLLGNGNTAGGNGVRVY
jgi:hypothetical protein